MRGWLHQHSLSLADDDLNKRLAKLDAFYADVTARYNLWMAAAVEVASLYGRMQGHLDRERVEREHRLDFLTPGTNPSAIRRQWRHYLADDYEPPTF